MHGIIPLKKMGTDKNIPYDEKVNIQIDDHNAKFCDDLLDYENEAFCVRMEGFVLNDKALCRENRCDNLSELILKLCNDSLSSICKKLKGSYCLYVYSKTNNNHYIINDMLSKRPVYYYIDEKLLIFSTSYFQLVDVLKYLRINLTVDLLGIKLLMKTGVFYDDITYIDQISYLKPYEYIHATNAIVSIEKIALPSMIERIDENEAMRKIDELFSDAVKIQFEKNYNNNYKQMATISGGMDSRTVLLYAHKLGYHDITCFTYSETGSMDQIISQKISADYSWKYFFHSLDKGNFLKNREQILKSNEAQMRYAGTTGLIDFIDFIDSRNIGLVHTGLGGGEIMGDILQKSGSNSENNTLLVKQFVDSLGLKDTYHEKRLTEKLLKYRSHNELKYLNEPRVYLNFMRTASNYFDVASPFLDEDFFEFVMLLPVEMKLRRKLYHKWVSSCIPNNYRTTNYSGARTNSLIERAIRIRIHNLFIKLGIKTKLDMNPFHDWFKNNATLNPYFDSTFKNDIEALEGIDTEIKSLLRDAYKLSIDKTYVLTASWALTRIYSNKRVV